MKQIRRPEQRRELDEDSLRRVNGGEAQHLRDLDDADFGDVPGGEGTEKVGPLRPTTRIFPG